MSAAEDIAAGNRGGAETPHAGVTERMVDAVIAELDRGLPREISVEVMPDKPKDFDLGSREGAGLVHYRSSKYQAAEVNGAGYQIRTLTLDVHLIVRGLTGRLGAPALLDASRLTLQGRRIEGATGLDIVSEEMTSENDGVWVYVQTFTCVMPAVALQRFSPDRRPFP